MTVNTSCDGYIHAPHTACLLALSLQDFCFPSLSHSFLPYNTVTMTSNLQASLRSFRNAQAKAGDATLAFIDTVISEIQGLQHRVEVLEKRQQSSCDCDCKAKTNEALDAVPVGVVTPCTPQLRRRTVLNQTNGGGWKLLQEHGTIPSSTGQMDRQNMKKKKSSEEVTPQDSGFSKSSAFTGGDGIPSPIRGPGKVKINGHLSDRVKAKQERYERIFMRDPSEFEGKKSVLGKRRACNGSPNCPKCHDFFKGMAVDAEDPDEAYNRAISKHSRCFSRDKRRARSPPTFHDLTFPETQTQPPSP